MVFVLQLSAGTLSTPEPSIDPYHIVGKENWGRGPVVIGIVLLSCLRVTHLTSCHIVNNVQPFCCCLRLDLIVVVGPDIQLQITLRVVSKVCVEWRHCGGV